jgi:hypothetical protein
VVDGVEGPRSPEREVLVPFPGTSVQDIHELTPKQAHGKRVSVVVVDFSAALNQADAHDLTAFHLVTLGKLNKKTGQHATTLVKLTSAVYNATTNTVTLALAGTLPNQPLELSINTSALLDAFGLPIAGNSGQSGGTFQATFGKKGVTL